MFPRSFKIIIAVTPYVRPGFLRGRRNISKQWAVYRAINNIVFFEMTAQLFLALVINLLKWKLLKLKYSQENVYSDFSLREFPEEWQNG